MDVDDDDAFLYGDAPEPATVQTGNASSVKEVEVKPGANNAAAVPTPAAVPAPLVPARAAAALGVSSAMAASLAAYGIDPSAAVVEPTLEDGGVEEDEEEDETDSEDDEDDVKMVFTGQTGRALDLRKTQQAPSNVIGIGKWAHTSTGQTAAPVVAPTPPRPQPVTAVSANQTTEYNPASRPGATPTPIPGSNAYPQIPSSGDSGTAPNLLNTSQQAITNGPPANPSLPHSDLPPVLAASSHPSVDPLHPTGIIPSTGNSVYDMDLAMFEGSGQLWRRPGSDLSDWFNFGFDEVSFPKFLRFRAEMEAGRNAMMAAPPMAPITPEVLHMLNLSLPAMGNANGNIPTPAQPNQGNNFNLNPQMMQQMQQMMSMQGMDMGMMAQMMGNMGGAGMGNMAQMAGVQNGQMGAQGGIQGQGQAGAGQVRPNQVQRPSATPGPATAQNAESGEEVKQEEIDPTAEGYVEVNIPPAGMGVRGRGIMRGVPARGGMLRGRGAAPLGPRAAAGIIPTAPKGPKAGRFRDKDRVESSVSGGLDYGGGTGTDTRETESGSARRGRSRSDSGDRSRGRSYTPSRSSSQGGTRSPDKRRRGEEEGEYTESKSRRSSKRSESPSSKGGKKSKSSREKEKEKERYKERERVKRKRDDGSLSVGLGPGGWGEDGAEGEDRRSRRRRSYSSASEEEGHKSKTTSSKRRQV